MYRKWFVYILFGLLQGCCSKDQQKTIVFKDNHIKDGIQNQASLKQLKVFFKNNKIQAVWSKRIAKNEYLMVLEEEVYKVLYVDFRNNLKSFKQISQIYPPYGECGLAINDVLTLTKDYFIISEISYGSGYCADFPSVYSLETKKRLTIDPFEILEFNFPEFSDHYYLSEINYFQKKHSIVAEIVEYKVNDETRDTVGIRKIEKILYQ